MNRQLGDADIKSTYIYKERTHSEKRIHNKTGKKKYNQKLTVIRRDMDNRFNDTEKPEYPLLVENYI